MIQEIQKLIDSYTRWIKDKTVLRELHNGWVEITTPSLDRHNDCIQLYVRKEGSGLLLTDNGHTLEDLELSGSPLESPRRQTLLHSTLAGFGVQHGENGQILVKASQENFALKKHNLLQAVLAVNDLFYLSSPHVESLFLEDLTTWLDEKDIRYTPRVKFAGQSGFDHMFDFVIPKSRHAPERVLHAISHPRKDKAGDLLFRWQDTRLTRADDAVLFAMLNDQDSSVNESVLNAFTNYGATPVLWSEREAIRERLAA